MKKLIPIFLAVLCLTACGNEQVKNPDTLSTAVISSSDSVTAKNTLNSLNVRQFYLLLYRLNQPLQH